MDFWSIHGMVENYKGFRKIILGDYQLQFGQGLIFGAGFGVGKGSETINALERVNTGAKPYTSVIEGGFLRELPLPMMFLRKWKSQPLLLT